MIIRDCQRFFGKLLLNYFRSEKDLVDWCLTDELQQQKLHELVKAGNVEQFQQFLNQHFGGDVNFQNETGWTCLQVASYHGSQALVEHLLKNDRLDVNASNAAGQTALHLSSRNGYPQIVEALIAAAKKRKGFQLGDFVEAQDGERKWTALFYAANSPQSVEGVIQVVRILVESGQANTTREDARGMQPAEVALINRRLDVAKFLLDKTTQTQISPARKRARKTISHLAAEFNLPDFLRQMGDHFNASALDALGQAPACYAASNGSLEFGREMLAKSLAVNVGNCIYYDHKNGKITGSPLHAASYNRHKGYVELLLATLQNSTIDVKDSRGGSPAHAMAWKPGSSLALDDSIFQLLYNQNKTILESRDNDGNTPFLLTARTYSLDFAKILRLKFGADLDAIDSNGNSALHLAENVDFLDFVWSLTKQRTSIDLRTSPANGNYTPFLTAVKERKSIDAISFFINRKADKNAVDTLGQGALHLAVMRNHVNALQIFLTDPSFNLSLRDKHGRTPFLFAIDSGRIDAVKSFLASRKLLLPGEEKMPETGDSPLHIAAKRNQHEIARLLLEAHPNLLSTLNDAKQTALHAAVEHQSLKTVNVFLGVDAASGTGLLTYRDIYGRTALHVAALTCDNFRIVERLSEHLETINLATTVSLIRDIFGETALESAIKRNCIASVKRLLWLGNCTQTNGQGLTPLHLAKLLGFNKLVDEMLKTRRCSLDQVDTCEVSVREMDEPRKAYVCSEQLPTIRHSLMAPLPIGELETFCVGATRKFICKKGADLKGSNVIECGKSGSWIVSGYCDDKVAVELQRKLGEAAADGKLGEVGSLMSLGYLDVNWVDPAVYTGDCGDLLFPRTALNRALACKRPVALISLLLDSGADLTIKSRRDDSIDALTLAANVGPVETVRLLLDRGADVKRSDSALPEAIYSGHVDIVQLLLERGANVNPTRPGAPTALMAASQRGDVETARMLLNRGGDVNLRANLVETDGIGDTALMTAAYFGKDGIVRLLIERGAKLDDINEALHSAVNFNGKLSTVRLLFNSGADVNNAVYGYNGETILMSTGDIGLVELILDSGADVNARDKSGNTALIHAAKNKLKDVTIAELLLNRGADINAANANGETALKIAVAQDRVDFISLLIQRGANRSGCTHQLCLQQ